MKALAFNPTHLSLMDLELSASTSPLPYRRADVDASTENTQEHLGETQHPRPTVLTKHKCTSKLCSIKLRFGGLTAPFKATNLPLDLLESEFGVAGGAREASDTPGFVESRHDWRRRRRSHKNKNQTRLKRSGTL